VKDQAHVGDTQLANNDQCIKELLSRDSHHEHDIMNMFDIEATRMRCKEMAKQVLDEKRVETGIKGRRSYPKRRR
jgi:hypothetical protein